MSNVNPVPEASAGDVVVVIIAGAIGGFLSVAGALTQPEVWTAFGPPTWFRYVILPLMLGGLAGGVAVFVLTHFDSANKLRMFFFAAVCGLGFPQVIGTALSLVGGDQSQAALNQVGKDQAAKLTALIDDPPASSAALTKQVESVLSLAPKVTSPAAKQAVSASLQKAIEALPGIEAPRAAAEKLSDIAVNATNAGEYVTAAQAVTALDDISSKSRDEHVKATAVAARREVREKLPQPVRAAVSSLATAAAAEPPQQ